MRKTQFTVGFLMARRASVTLMLGLSCATMSNAATDIFNTAGTTNWVCPPGVTSITVECWGGGGAGGGAFVDAANGGAGNAGGGSGGGGAYAKLESVAVTPGSSYVITIPAAATCPASGFANNQRYNGSAVSFNGDSQTVTANGGQGGQCRIVTTTTASSGSNGPGGTAGTGFDASFSGATSAQWSGGNGNGGGGGAGDLGNGGAAAASNGSAGAGGAGSDAEHTGGSGGAARNGAGIGNDAASPGGGGGGAKSTTTSTTSRRGGTGGLGRIILTYTIPLPDTKTKANNTTNLDQGSSWIGGVAPSSLELAKWDNTVTSANTTVLGADLTWGGVLIEDPAGPVTVGGANTLTVGGAVTDIDMSTATNDLTVNCPIALGNANVWDIAALRTLTIGGAVSGDFPITLQGSGRVRLGAGDLLPNGAGNNNLTLNGTLDLNGHSEIINGLSGGGIVDTTAASAAVTLTAGGNNQSSTFDGILQNTGSSSTLNLVKTGVGTLVLNGQNTMSGTVSITDGTLGLNGANAMDNVTGITMAGGTMLRAQLTGTTIVPPITLGGESTTTTIAAPLLPANNTDATTPKELNLRGDDLGRRGSGSRRCQRVQSIWSHRP
jgi:autotransporter-associated beta strand protein